MQNVSISVSATDRCRVYGLRRRELIPVGNDALWQITAGAVRVYTLTDTGKSLSLGFWGVGDVIGQPLVEAQPCLMECLTQVNVMAIRPAQRLNLQPVMLAHIHQMQELLEIRHGRIQYRLEKLLGLLACKFGCPTEQGQLIQCRLTQQDMADTVGTSRVTVTRLLQKLQDKGIIGYSKRNYIILCQCPADSQ